MSAFQRLGLNPSLIHRHQHYTNAQEQTKETFAFKWSKRETYESDSVKARAKTWLLEKYCHGTLEQLNDWLSGERKIILDVGCGSGFSALLFFGEHLQRHDYLGVDISDAVNIAKIRFEEEGVPGDFLQCSLLDLPIPSRSVDIIFAEGVLHHTDSTAESIAYLAQKLKPSGRFLFYVYAKKAIIREFADDYIRQYLQGLTDEESWEALKPLTRLGIALGELQGEIDVPEAIPFLGIPKGKFDIQRFFYWYLCKVFYRPEFTFEEMHHINFDWYKPLHCHRHTPEEITTYCQDANLCIERLHVEPSGITVVARKQ